MNEFLQLCGAISLGVFCLFGICATIGCCIYALGCDGGASDEWEESEDSELERSITVEEFCTIVPPIDIVLAGAEIAAPQLTRRTTKKSTMKTSSLSRPQAKV